MRIIHLSLLTLIIAACSSHDRSYYINFYNTSDYTLCVDFDCSYPDDSVTTIREIMGSVNPCYSINPHSYSKVWQGIGKRQSWYSYFDDSYSGFVSFYIIDDRVKDKGDVEKIQREYDILARYDVTINDIESLDWSLTYPPTEEMSYIHMYRGK